MARKQFLGRSQDYPSDRKSTGFKWPKCLHCGKYGHNADECYFNKPCFNCGELGHTLRNCQNPRKSGGHVGFTDESHSDRKSPGTSKFMKCFNCLQDRYHKSVDCPNDKACYNCGGSGHQSSNCPSEKKIRECYSCGKTGHMSIDCQNPRKSGGQVGFLDGSPSKREHGGGGGVINCYNRSGSGSFSKECPSNGKSTGAAKVKKCVHCGKYGHDSAECYCIISCYNCGGTGHVVKDCPSGIQCHNCGEYGHKVRDCHNRRYSADLGGFTDGKRESTKQPAAKKMKPNEDEI